MQSKGRFCRGPELSTSSLIEIRVIARGFECVEFN